VSVLGQAIRRVEAARDGVDLIELFAGAGGASLGLERAGWGRSLMVERNPWAAATLRAAVDGGRLNGLVVEQDVRTVDWRPWRGARAVWSSWPCQPHSVAGRRRAAGDERDGWPWTLRCLDAVRPTWFMGENVQGILLHKRGCGGRSVRTCSGCYTQKVILPSLRERFAWAGVRVIDAADLGTPQHRARAIFIAGPRLVPWPDATHAPFEIARDLGLRPYRTMLDALDPDTWGHLEPVYSGYRQSELGSLPAQRRQEIEGWGMDDWYCAHCDALVSSGACFCPSPSVAQELLDRPAPTLAGGSERSHVSGGSVLSATKSTRDRLLWGLRRYRTKREDDLWVSLVMGKISVEEATALAGFPLGWPFAGSDQRKYRQIANSVAPQVAEAIGRAVLERAMMAR